MSSLGPYIRELRKGRAETLHQVSKGTDIDSPLLSKIERGDRLPTNEQIVRLAHYYGVAEADLGASVRLTKLSNAAANSRHTRLGVFCPRSTAHSSSLSQDPLANGQVRSTCHSLGDFLKIPVEPLPGTRG